MQCSCGKRKKNRSKLVNSTEQFPILEPRHPAIGVFELHKIGGSADCQALKSDKVQSGSELQNPPLELYQPEF